MVRLLFLPLVLIVANLRILLLFTTRYDIRDIYHLDRLDKYIQDKCNF